MVDQNRADLVSSQKQSVKEFIFDKKEELYAFLEKAVSHGYNQIRIPAGTSSLGDYSTQVCAMKKIQGKWFVGLLPYNSRVGKAGIKTKQKPIGETYDQTGIREVWEELKIVIKNPISVFRKKDNGKPESRDPDEKKKHLFSEHLVHRLITFEVEGEIAYFPDFKNPDDPETGQGFWLALDLLDTVFKMDPNKEVSLIIFQRHLDTIFAAMDKIMTEDKDAMYELAPVYQSMLAKVA